MNTGVFDVSKSSYYQYWLEEKKAIEDHKWYLSEKLGRDCGWNYAEWDWCMRYRSEWLKNRRKID